jgi:hypothetical protein
MQRITTDGDTVKYDIYRQRESTADSGFSTSPEQRISATDPHQHLAIHSSGSNYQGGPTDSPSSKLQNTRNKDTGDISSRICAATINTETRQQLLAGLTLLHEDALYWIRHQWESNGLLVSATDGPAPDDGTFGWVVALPDGTALVECNGPADGTPDQISSGCAESTGVLSLGTFFLVTAAYLETTPQGHCRNYIDSTAALRRAQRSSQPQQALRSRISLDMDIMTAYRNLGQPIYSYIMTRWVKGHQDKFLSYANLSTQAKMNMQTDELAEQYRENHRGPHQKSHLSQPCAEPIPGQSIQLVVNGYAVSQAHAHWIRFQVTGYDMRQYLQDRHDWDRPTWENIDWFGFEKAI